MRKLLNIAFVTFLLIVSWAVFQSNDSRLAAADYGDRLFLSHQHDRPIASAAVEQAPARPVETQRVTYGTVDGKPITGYLARPADATEPLPGLIVIHEFWGLNENIEAMTQRLAGEGYTALAVDLFGQVADTPEAARAQVQAVSQTPQLLQENLRQAYQYLETEQQATQIGSIGWCFGGSWSLQTALLFPDQLNATVIYYGSQLVTDPAQLRSLEVPILGLFGALDTNPSVKKVREFESALKSLGKSVEVHIYDGANHAFANPSGTRYNAEAAEDAWRRAIAFLNEHLK
ncbi:MAG TPA: dienelactone hydrolase family protein [Crinalium sp.]|jgi:carboxymethylenebutenolidase